MTIVDGMTARLQPLETADGTPLTDEESDAVRALQRLAKRWPRTFKLFSWSGTLMVFKPGDKRTNEQARVTSIHGIPNDGGDPQDWEEC